jgi:CDGSH-type Zn-finger protein
MFVVTFYVLALFPIKHCVDWLLCRCGLSEETSRSFQ